MNIFLPWHLQTSVRICVIVFSLYWAATFQQSTSGKCIRELDDDCDLQSVEDMAKHMHLLQSRVEQRMKEQEQHICTLTDRLTTVESKVNVTHMMVENMIVGPTQVQLVGGSHTTGRLEVWHDGQWGTVCDDNFSNTSALVVCRTLGYRSQIAYYRDDDPYGVGTGQIWMDGLVCTGREPNISYCTFNGWGAHNCKHHEDVTIVCN